MSVKCLYCGKEIPEDIAHCPHCGAVSHFQQKGYRAGARRRFLFWLVVLVLFSLLMAFWLPRTIPSGPFLEKPADPAPAQPSRFNP